MQEESIQGYIFFGTALRYLQEASAGRKIQGRGRVAGNLRIFLDRLDALGLSVTANAAGHEGLPQLLLEFDEASKDAVLTQQQATK